MYDRTEQYDAEQTYVFDRTQKGLYEVFIQTGEELKQRKELKEVLTRGTTQWYHFHPLGAR